jgi:hypothetical protein
MANAATSEATKAIQAPAPPSVMSNDAGKQWQATYSKALAQAKLDTPDNEPAQRAAALKAANALLAIPAPANANDIAKLDKWQVLLREDRVVDGVPTRVCVTSDGRKYAFPIPAPTNGGK